MSIFTQTAHKRPTYSTFDLSHQKKLSCNFGDLVPIMVQECVPGDKWSSQTAQLVRLAPMIAPLMHQVSVYTHFFFVPNRITWPSWENFITGEDGFSNQPSFPNIALTSSWTQIGGLADYMGCPTSTISQVNALPFAAYQKVYNEFYRDQNLITEVPDEVVDGSNLPQHFVVLRKRAWQHDYFTSALPWTQKGPQATIPLGDTAPVDYVSDGNNDLIRTVNGSLITGTNRNFIVNNGLTQVDNALLDVTLDNSAHLQVDLSNATAAAIIDLRNAFRLQEWLEKNAKGGTRYNESILTHFGVNIGDARLNRPEFLGGGSQPISVSEVLQTSSTDATTPQGNMAGHGISAGQSSKWSYTCKEHGFIIGIMSIMPKTAYQQGYHKLWHKFDKFDYYWPSFAHVGEQPIYNKEIYYDTDFPANEEVFGYTPRYAEYKYCNDSVHGEFRTTLDFWHWGRKFDSRPSLNEVFINCDPDDRIFANTTGEKLYVQIYHNIKAKRPMPYFGNPTI